jgi:hypothetical protein
MSRPEFPNCIMPVSVIRGILEEQRHYDEDPERYERRERERKEEYEREQMDMQERMKAERQRQEQERQLDEETP